MNPALRRSLVLSALLHLLILLAALISLPAPILPEAPEGTSFDVQFESVPKGPAHGPIAKRSPTPSPKTTQPQQTKPQPIAPETAPPPPPPPAPVRTEAPQPTPTPPKLIPLTSIPIPTPSPTPETVKLQQPKPAEVAATMPSIPIPPEPVDAPPSQSTTSQPNKAKNTVASSETLEETLAKLRFVTQDKIAPTAHANPDSGGALVDSGNPASNDTSTLTAADRGAIGDAVRPCWTRDAGALNADQLQVMIQVTTGPDGVAHIAHVDPSYVDQVNSDPVLQAFSDRAVNAVLDAQCAKLPLPAWMLGQNHTFSFLFKP